MLKKMKSYELLVPTKKQEGSLFMNSSKEEATKFMKEHSLRTHARRRETTGTGSEKTFKNISYRLYLGKRRHIHCYNTPPHNSPSKNSL